MRELSLCLALSRNQKVLKAESYPCIIVTTELSLNSVDHNLPKKIQSHFHLVLPGSVESRFTQCHPNFHKSQWKLSLRHLCPIFFWHQNALMQKSLQVLASGRRLLIKNKNKTKTKKPGNILNGFFPSWQVHASRMQKLHTAETYWQKQCVLYMWQWAGWIKVWKISLWQCSGKFYIDALADIRTDGQPAGLILIITQTRYFILRTCV